MVDLVALKVANARRWAAAKPTRNFTSVARALVAPSAKARYQAVEKLTGVPWYFIAVVHEREASQNWDTHLAQGDPLGKPTTHIPVGEPAFNTWEQGAVDALVNCPPYAARNKDWSIGGFLTMLEQYNGLGYFNGPVTIRNGVVIARYPSQPSPYIWAGTDQYTSGKYVRDREFDQNFKDGQLGCAGLLMAMAALDRSISLGKPPIVILPTTPQPQPPDIPRPDPVPQVQPAKPSFWAAFVAFITSLFSGKSQ